MLIPLIAAGYLVAIYLLLMVVQRFLKATPSQSNDARQG